jgi:hypothetical protein
MPPDQIVKSYIGKFLNNLPIRQEPGDKQYVQNFTSRVSLCGAILFVL